MTSGPVSDRDPFEPPLSEIREWDVAIARERTRALIEETAPLVQTLRRTLEQTTALTERLAQAAARERRTA